MLNSFQEDGLSPLGQTDHPVLPRRRNRCRLRKTDESVSPCACSGGAPALHTITRDWMPVYTASRRGFFYMARRPVTVTRL